MKITRLEPILVYDEARIPNQFLYVRVHTDEGLTGLGEVGLSPKALTIKAHKFSGQAAEKIAAAGGAAETLETIAAR